MAKNSLLISKTKKIEQSRRRFQRFIVHFKLIVREKKFTGEIVDLSLSGLKLKIVEGKNSKNYYDKMVNKQFRLNFEYDNKNVDSSEAKLIRIEKQDNVYFLAFQFMKIPVNLFSKIFYIVLNE